MMMMMMVMILRNLMILKCRLMKGVLCFLIIICYLNGRKCIQYEMTGKSI